MIDTLKIFDELSQAMDPAAARKLAEVLGRIYQDLQNTVTKAEFQELKDAVRELAQAQKRTEQRVGELAEAQKRTEIRVGSLEKAVQELAEAQKRTEAALLQLVEQVRGHDIRLAKLDGRTLEMQFRDKAAAYLGRVMRGVRVISAGDLADELDGVLTNAEWEDLLRIDVLVRGRALVGGVRQEVFAAVEVSVTLDEGDVMRAARRAGLLRKKGWKTLAVAAGEELSNEVIATAAAQGVAVLRDGQQANWEQALASA